MCGHRLNEVFVSLWKCQHCRVKSLYSRDFSKSCLSVKDGFWNCHLFTIQKTQPHSISFLVFNLSNVFLICKGFFFLFVKHWPIWHKACENSFVLISPSGLIFALTVIQTFKGYYFSVNHDVLLLNSFISWGEK